MLFAKRVFFWSGVYGLVALTPLYFLESMLNELAPPPIVHPEHFYGFVGVALSWQIAFLIISRDPVRYRLLMIPSILEKLSFGVGGWVLFIAGRSPAQTVLGGTVDLALAALFMAAFFRTAPTTEGSH
jgi:hypothetical protein